MHARSAACRVLVEADGAGAGAGWLCSEGWLPLASDDGCFASRVCSRFDRCLSPHRSHRREAAARRSV